MGEPKYMHVVEWIQKQIEIKKLVPGSKLYSENELSDMFSLSRQTIRHAIGLLEQKGIVIRVKGSGTYINTNLDTNFAQRTRIALVTTYVNSYIFPKTIQGIERVLSEKGYTVQISFTNNTVERERRILNDLIEKNEVAGIIMEPTKSGLPNPNMSLYQELRKLRIPILFINSYYNNLDIPHVSLNDKLVAKKATKYLIEHGHQHIGAILKSDDGQGHLRYSGFCEAMCESNLVIEDESVMWIDTFDIQHLSLVSDYIMNRLMNCTAVLCYNDQVAYDYIKILQEKNLHVPDDISIISIDGSELTNIGDVKITSLSHPLDHLGEIAALHLVEMIHNPMFDATYEFDTEINEQMSVKSNVLQQ